MKFLKNRKIAILITVVVAVAATLIGVNRSLSRLSRDIEQMFYDGVYLESEKRQQQSIDSQIEKISATALNLATLLENHPGLESESASVLNARKDLINAGSIRDKGSALSKLENAFNGLVTATDSIPDLGERESAALAEHRKTYDGASIFIEGSLAPEYNSKVDDFYRDRSFFAALISRAAPDYFR